jgi:ankyrin repeat protein
VVTLLVAHYQQNGLQAPLRLLINSTNGNGISPLAAARAARHWAAAKELLRGGARDEEEADLEREGKTAEDKCMK